VYAPPAKSRDPERSSFDPRPQDSPEVAAWRQRMGTVEAKAIYKQRAATIELVNADLKEWRGLRQLRVVGRAKAQCVLLWSVLTFNLMRWIARMPAATA
jgi:hypothetical protein